MSTIQQELDSFNQFVAEKLRAGKADLTLDQCFWQWRETREVLKAVREGMEDIKAGRVYTLEEVKLKLEEDRRRWRDSVEDHE